MRGEVNSPSQRSRSDQHLYLLFDKQLLNDLSVPLVQTGVMDPDATPQEVLDVVILHVPDFLLEFLFAALQPLQGVHVNQKAGDQIVGGEARLFSRRAEYQGRAAGGVFLDGLVGGAIHGHHARAVVPALESLYVDF